MNCSFPDQALRHESCREAIIETHSPTPAPPITGFTHPEPVASATCLCLLKLEIRVSWGACVAQSVRHLTSARS